MTDGYFSSFFFERYFTGWLVPASEIYRWETEEVKRKKKNLHLPLLAVLEYIISILSLSFFLRLSFFK